MIEKSSDLYNGEAILYDNSNDLYLYGKALSDSELLLVVEGEEYYVSIEQDSIYFTSSNNNKLKVYEFIGAGNTYFHTVRPDYAGQNCIAYE